MRSLQGLGATIALLSASAWWTAIAVITRALMSEADSVRGQLLWMVLSAVAIVAAAFFVYLALAFRPMDDGLDAEPAPEYLPSDRGPGGKGAR